MFKDQNYTIMIDIPYNKIQLFATCMGSFDVSSALGAIEYKEHPRMYSIIQGTGILNDIGALTLFNVV